MLELSCCFISFHRITECDCVFVYNCMVVLKIVMLVPSDHLSTKDFFFLINIVDLCCQH